jgi:hypothetical protein
LTLLGTGSERVLLREEEREHLHIIGTTNEGKSKFLEYLMRKDIDEGRGLCFLDPSEMGKTLYDVLRYCYAKKIKKVCLIDPFHRYQFNTVPIINPFHKAYKAASVAHVMETIQTVFGQKDSADTPRINKYLPSILKILWASKSTLSDSVYFSHRHYVHQRCEMYEDLDTLDRDVMTVEDMYRTVYSEKELQSTINRLQPFFEDTLSLIFGHTGGINFPKMISEGWVILVNLYSGFGFNTVHTRLLGTTIINEIIFALDRLSIHGWKGKYNLYIDEAGRYANRNLADLLAYKRKSGLRVTIAHQYFDQFEDKYVLDAVNNLCKLKVAFYIPNCQDRDFVVRMLYGGELADRDVSYVLSSQKKQYAVIKKPKKSPIVARIPDVPSIELPKGLLERYIMNIYTYPWYKTPKEVQESINDRFSPPKNPQRPQSGKAPHRAPTGKVAVPKRAPERSEEPRVPTGDEAPQEKRTRKDKSKGPIRI